VILMGERGAEEGHDPVAHDLVDRAFIVMDGFHHALEDGIEELPGLLGVTVGKQFHGAFEVREEDGDLLPLAFQSGSGREDLLGEVLRRVALRGTLRRSRCDFTQRLPTAITEATAGWIGLTAALTGGFEPGSASVAEPRASGTLLPALRACHGGSLARLLEIVKRAEPACPVREGLRLASMKISFGLASAGSDSDSRARITKKNQAARCLIPMGPPRSGFKVGAPRKSAGGPADFRTAGR